MVKYTFLLPAYKAFYFADALRSIKEQTYSDFYCVVSDDCSPNDLWTIFRKEVGDDKRFVYRKNLRNIGSTDLAEHWNLLLQECRTEYFILASDDDVYDCRFLEDLNGYTEKYSNVNLFRGRVKYIDENGETLEVETLFEERETQMSFLFKMYNTNFIHCIGNYIFKTKFIKDINGFIDFPLAWFSDDATILRAAETGTVCSNEILFSFRVSDYNISNIKSDKGKNKLKVKASQLYYCWFRDYLTEFVFSHTKENDLLFTKARKGCIERIISMITSYSCGLGFIHLFDIFIWRSRNDLFDGIRERVCYWWCLFTELKSLMK